jgi:chemotaxis protein MotB
MASHDQPVIVIKKKKGGHGGHHGGSWKVAYADFVTAMMAFFLVMWIMGLDASTRKAIEAYFKDPTGYNGAKAGTAVTSSQEGDGILPFDGRTPIPAPPDLARLREALKKAQKEMAAEIASSKDFRELSAHIQMQLTEEGLRIELVESSKPIFFAEASAQLNPTAVKLLRSIGARLAKIPAPVSLEGHTDARPLSAAYGSYTNWELSSDRANAARRVLEQVLRPGQVCAVNGFGPRRLRNPKNPAAQENRRVSILVPLQGADSWRAEGAAEKPSQSPSQPPEPPTIR